MIQVKNLRKEYSSDGQVVEALKGINVEIPEGEIFGFIGLSGAGKTSLVRCISFLEPPSSGSVLINGVEMSGLKGVRLREARKQLGLVFQHFNLLMNSTVYENVAFPLAISRKPKDYIHKKTMELLEMVGLTDKKDAYPSKLSGGQKQRVGIARALADEPSIIICDEATSSLDPATTKSILALLKDINTKKGITLIVITHEMDVIKEICTKVAVLEDGEIIEAGDVVTVCTRPRTATAKKFFGSGTSELRHSAYKNILAEGSIIKSTFIGNGAVEPHICRMIKGYNVDAAILSGKIEEIGGTIIGCLTLKLTGNAHDVEAAAEYLRSKNIIVEKLEGQDLQWQTY